MAGHSIFGIQTGIHNLLKVDATLTGLLGSGENSMFDNPRQSDLDTNSLYPMLVYAQVTTKPWDTKDKNGMEALVDIHVYSRSSNKQEVSVILDRVHFLLHNNNIEMGGSKSVLLRYQLSDIFTVDDKDRITVQGVIRFLHISQQL